MSRAAGAKKCVCLISDYFGTFLDGFVDDLVLVSHYVVAVVKLSNN